MTTKEARLPSQVRCRRLVHFMIAMLQLCAVETVCAQSAVPGDLRAVVYHNAPFFIQEMSGMVDQIWPVDYDGDLLARNNRGPYVDSNGYHFVNVVNATPKVYYSVVETGLGPDEGYYLIGYYYYHAEDRGSIIVASNQGGHSNDMEGVWLVLKKSSTSPYGILRAALSEAHGALLPWVNDQQPMSPSPQGGWAGQIHMWTDNRYGHQRAVFGSAGRTHAAYGAQECATSGPTNPGMVLGSIELYGEFWF